MKRRAFISLLGGAAALSLLRPLAASPQHATGAATCRRAQLLGACLLLSLQPLKLLWGGSVRHPHICNRAWFSSQDSDRSYGPAIRGDIAYRTNLYLNRAPSASMSPVVGCGKWIGKTYLPVPAISVRNFRRDRAACAGSQSKIVDQSGSRHCKVWCMRSPITTACCPRERILTQQWWGEWPGVGTSQNVSSS